LPGKIKILYATDGLGNGGKERQLVETIKHLDSNKFDIGVISFNTNQYYSELAEHLSEYYSVFIKDKNVLEPFISVFNAFERYKPDIVHSFDVLSSMYTYMPSILYRSKIVNATIQDSGLDKGWQYKIKRFLLKVADINISNSLAGFRYYNSWGELLYNFINPDRFKGNKRYEGFNVAMIANFTDYKDYSSYFNIIRELVSKSLIDTAYAVGAGKYLNKYRNGISEDEVLNKKVVFTGNISDIEELLRSVSVGFLLSTEEYGEGISNSVLEYMASGVIPIVSDIGGSSEIIDTGIDGFLVNKDDLDGITNIMLRLKNDEKLREELIKNARLKIEQKFSLTKNIQKLEKIYTGLKNN
jgi:glycosyltransferase involved in cell wall biosynthesis